MPITFMSGYSKCNWPLSADPYVRIKQSKVFHSASNVFSVHMLLALSTHPSNTPLLLAHPTQFLIWKLLLRDLVENERTVL